MPDYLLYPAVDDDYNFAPEVREVLASSSEFTSKFGPQALSSSTELNSVFGAAAITQTLEFTRAVGRITGTVDMVREFGADPDGVEPIDDAWSRMIAEVDNGTQVIFDGRFLATTCLKNSDKEIHVMGLGSEFTRDAIGPTGDEELAMFSGSYGVKYRASTMAVQHATAGSPLTTILTLTALPNDVKVGDSVRVIGDNYVTASRYQTSRVGFPGTVVDITGLVVTIFGGPYSGDTYDTNIRMARINPTTASWTGGLLKRADAYNIPSVKGSMIALRDLINPRISQTRIGLSSGAGYLVSGCYGADLDQLTTQLLRDSWSDTGISGPVFAYHVLDNNSFGTRVRNFRFFGGRHGVSTAQSTPPADQLSNSNMLLWGISEYMMVQNGFVEGTYVAGYDTHEASRGCMFDTVIVVGAGFAGFGLRGRNHSINNFQAIDCYRGVYMFDDEYGGESYGHRLTNGLIDNPRANAIVGDYHRKTGHPLIGQRQEIGITAFTADNIEITRCTSSAVQVTNGRVGTLNLRVIWDKTPLNPSAIIESVNSEFRGGEIMSDNRLITGSPVSLVLVLNGGDTSIVELEHARILGVTAQIDRIVRSGSNSMLYILPDVLLDEQATIITNPPGIAASVLDFKTLSGTLDSGKIELRSNTADLDILVRSLKSPIIVQASLAAARTLPPLPVGRLQGQQLIINNRPPITGGSTAAMNLTIGHGNTARTYLKSASPIVLQPRQSAMLAWDVETGRWTDLL